MTSFLCNYENTYKVAGGTESGGGPVLLCTLTAPLLKAFYIAYKANYESVCWSNMCALTLVNFLKYYILNSFVWKPGGVVVRDVAKFISNKWLFAKDNNIMLFKEWNAYINNPNLYWKGGYKVSEV